MSYEILVAAAIVLAIVAAARRLLRPAAVLLAVAVLLGAGPSAIDAARGGIGDLADTLSGGVSERIIDAVQDGGSSTSARRPEAVDGDTIRVREDGQRVSVRVALVDAGESSSSRYGRPTCGGAQASAFAERWTARRSSVRLRTVSGLPREDRYDRRLARVLDREGRDYGLGAVRAGWARVTVYEQPRGAGDRYLDRLRGAERQARRAGRGSWGACDWRNQDGVR